VPPPAQVFRHVRRVDSEAVAPDSIWELVFLMVILKIPIVYLCVIVWYAIKAEPRRGRGTPVAVRTDPEEPGPGWGRRRRSRRQPPRRPHGGPSRLYPRTPRTAMTGARAGRR
jgi:hypothetical protein